MANIKNRYSCTVGMMDDYLKRQLCACDNVARILHTDIAKQKFKSLGELVELVQSHKKDGETVVASGGAYALPHFAHMTYLEQVKKLGDLHIALLNSDSSLQAYGKCAQFVPEHGRIIFLANCVSVDYVTLFEDASPVAALGILRPDIFAKGGNTCATKLNQTLLFFHAI